MRIFVTNTFQQQAGDAVIESLGSIVLIDATDPSLYDVVDDTDGSLMDLFVAGRIKEIVSAVSMHMDKAANFLRYDDMKSVRGYAGVANAYQTEAVELTQWASDCWKTLEGVETNVLAGTQIVPTVDEAIALLPAHPISVDDAFIIEPEVPVKLP